MRYIQKQQPDGSFKLVEVTDSRRGSSSVPSVFVRGDLNFRSPVDGSIISSHSKLREHNKRHNVVQQGEMGTQKEIKSFYDRKEQERGDVFNNTTNTHVGRAIKKERIQHIVEAMQKHER